jgi:rubrerythrin
MERFVRSRNIQHYRELLARVTDPAQRRTIERLIAEEQEKLAATHLTREDSLSSTVERDPPLPRSP